MDSLSGLQSQKIYLDTNIWIYALEGYPIFSPFLTALFQAIDDGKLCAVTSELTLAEALVKPMMDNNLLRQQAYLQALQNTAYLSVVPISRQILIEATQLRATTSLKLPDAIHVATALSHRCDTFLTNDKRLPTIKSLNLIQISNLVGK